MGSTSYIFMVILRWRTFCYSAKYNLQYAVCSMQYAVCILYLPVQICCEFCQSLVFNNASNWRTSILFNETKESFAVSDEFYSNKGIIRCWLLFKQRNHSLKKLSFINMKIFNLKRFVKNNEFLIWLTGSSQMKKRHNLLSWLLTYNSYWNSSWVI